MNKDIGRGMSSRIAQLILITTACLAAIAATDIFLPSLPQIAIYFSATDNKAQLAIPLFLFGQLLGAPLWGILSDRIKRNRIILLGLAIFLLGTVICIFSGSIDIFLTGRFLQGLGAIVGPVVGWAIIQDLYPKDEAAKIMTWVGGILIVGPIIAPSIGGYIDVTFGWKVSFWVIAILVFSCIVGAATIKTASDRVKKSKLSLLETFKTYATILSHKKFLSYASLYAVLISGITCYLTVIPFYFEKSLDMNPESTGIYMALAGAGYILGTFITNYFLKHHGVDKAIAWGVGLALLGGLLLLTTGFILPTFPTIIAGSMGVLFVGESLIWSSATSRALQCFSENQGAASAVRSIVVMSFITFGGLMGSALDDLTLVPMATFIMMTAVAALIIFNTKTLREDRR